MDTIAKIRNYIEFCNVFAHEPRIYHQEHYDEFKRRTEEIRKEMDHRAYICGDNVYVWIDDEFDGYVGIYSLVGEMKRNG